VAGYPNLAEVFSAIGPHLAERQRRLLYGAHARAAQWGGISRVAEAAGVSRTTVMKGIEELDQPPPSEGVVRSRRPGGGRKAAQVKDPGLMAALDALVDPDTRGDPESPLRWTCKSTRQLADALTAQGHPVSHRVVGVLLRSMKYSLQGNAKVVEGKQHPDRDAQFRYLNEQVRQSLEAGTPVISVDTKKKELVGNFKNAGREWQREGEPERVNVHDFADPELGKAIPYGVYDLAEDSGWVNVGTDHDTAAFAVESIRRWWQQVGRAAYAVADRLLICADGGGSNGYRLRLWKWELARFASESGLTITACHFPPATSKWNKIEHRLFAHISSNWRGRPLVSHEVIVELIGATSTRSGLQVKAELDLGIYPAGVEVSDKAFAAIPLSTHPFHGEWNYSITPGLGQPP
jgi:DDE family transposase